MGILKRVRSFVQKVANRAGMNEKDTGLAQDLIRGISESGSTRLTEIAEVLDKGEDVPLIRTVQRLSKGLKAADSGLDDGPKAYLGEIGSVARGLSWISVDRSENTHPYGNAFQFQCKVQDRSRPGKPIVPGYWTMEVEGTDGNHHHLPLYHDVYSTEDPAYQALGEEAWLEQTRKAIRAVLPFTSRTAIWLFDRGSDDNAELEFLLEHLPRHISRLCRRRRVVHLGNPREPTITNLVTLADGLRTPHPVQVEYVNKSTHKLQTFPLTFGFLPMRLPGIDHTYGLIVVRGVRGEAWLLLSSWVPRNAGEAAEIVKAYALRWGVEENIRCYKQCTGAEKVMVRSIDAIRRLTFLAMMAMGLQALWLFRNKRLAQRLVASVKAIIKEVPFVQYRLWKAVRKELVRTG